MANSVTLLVRQQQGGTPGSGGVGRANSEQVPFPEATLDTRTFELRSLDGMTVMRLDQPGFHVMTGYTGFGLTEVTNVLEENRSAGSTITSVRKRERKIFLPIWVKAPTHEMFLDLMQQFAALVDPDVEDPSVDNGHLLLVARSAAGERHLVVSYESGLEGERVKSTSGLNWAKVGLKLVAPNPYWYSPTLRSMQFRMGTASEVFLSNSDSDPWPRAISTTSIIGEGMIIPVGGQLPTWATIRVTGPSGASVSVTSNHGLDISTSGSVAAGSTLVIQTSDRRPSVRLDGEPAWGLMSLGSRQAPLRPGDNILNVLLPGATSASVVEVEWRSRWRSAW